MLEKSKLLGRSAGLIVASVAMFIAIPAAFAANSLVQNIAISPDPFHTQVPGHTDAAKVFITYDWNSGGNATGDVTEVIKDGQGNVVFYWGATAGADTRVALTPGVNEPQSLEWNGKANTGTLNGQYVPDGTYTFDVMSHVASPPDTEGTKTFSVVKTVAPAVTWTTPSTVYYTSSGNFTVNYHLDLGSASQAIVRLKLTNGGNTTTVTDTKMTSGDYSISWDGKIGGNPATPGTYTVSLQPEGSVDGFGTLGNELTSNLAVSATAPNPTLSGLTASPSPFNPNAGSITLGYVLAGSTGNTTVNAAVYKGNGNNAVSSWTFTNQSSGSNIILWDGKDNNSTVVSDGSYTFKVWGTDGNFSLVPMQTSFTVAAVSNPPGNQCAGFTDVLKTDNDCAAFTYLQSLGSMTGNPDGTLAPSDVLQRDQVAKIILETFGKFDSNASYCSGNPFPDVTSGSWAYQYICRGVALGMITGYKAGVDAGFYRPARAVNRVEFLALLLRNLSDQMPSNSMSSYGDVALNQWFTGYARYSMDYNLFTGSNLNPTNATTRREVGEIIYKLHQAGKF